MQLGLADIRWRGLGQEPLGKAENTAAFFSSKGDLESRIHRGDLRAHEQQNWAQNTNLDLHAYGLRKLFSLQHRAQMNRTGS